MAAAKKPVERKRTVQLVKEITIPDTRYFEVNFGTFKNTENVFPGVYPDFPAKCKITISGDLILVKAQCGDAHVVSRRALIAFAKALEAK